MARDPSGKSPVAPASGAAKRGQIKAQGRSVLWWEFSVGSVHYRTFAGRTEWCNRNKRAGFARE